MSTGSHFIPHLWRETQPNTLSWLDPPATTITLSKGWMLRTPIHRSQRSFGQHHVCDTVFDQTAISVGVSRKLRYGDGPDHAGGQHRLTNLGGWRIRIMTHSSRNRPRATGLNAPASAATRRPEMPHVMVFAHKPQRRARLAASRAVRAG